MWAEREKRDDTEDVDIEEALRGYVSRNKRAVEETVTLTLAQKACIEGNCLVCTPFLNATNPGADMIDIWRESKSLLKFFTSFSVLLK